MPLVNAATHTKTVPPLGAPAGGTDKAARILAKTLFRQLKDAGYQNRDILTLSTELVSLITTDLKT